MYDKVKHLEMIERVIERLSRFSFNMKSWSITLITVLVSIGNYVEEFNIIVLIIGLFVVLSFYILNGYYLTVEKSYRNLFNYVRTENENLNFNMSINENTKEKWFYGLIRFINIGFYGFQFILLIIIFLYFNS